MDDVTFMFKWEVEELGGDGCGEEVAPKLESGESHSHEVAATAAAASASPHHDDDEAPPSRVEFTAS